MKPADLHLTLSPAEIHWPPTGSDAAEPRLVSVAGTNAENKWEVVRCPWWLEARRQGEALEVRVRHSGKLRGSVEIRAQNGARVRLRVASQVIAAARDARPAKRRAWRFGLLWLLALFAVIVVALCSGGSGHVLGGISAICVLLGAAGWGWMHRNRALAVRSFFGVWIGWGGSVIVWRVLMDRWPRGVLPAYGGHGGGLLGDLASEFNGFIWAALLLVHGGVVMSAWGWVVGGRWLALAAGWRGAVSMLACFGLAPLAGYSFEGATFLATVLWLVCWQRMLGVMLAPVPGADALGPSLAPLRLWRNVATLGAALACAIAASIGIAWFTRSPYALQRTVFPAVGGGPGRSAAALHATAPPGTKLWEFPTKTEPDGEPAPLASSADGMLYWSGDALCGFDPRTGHLWEVRSSGHWSFSAPVPAPDETVLSFGGGGPYLHAFGRDGRRKWSTYVGEQAFGLTVHRDGSSFIAGASDVHAFDRAGRPKWKFRSSEPMQSRHVLKVAADGTVYLTSGKTLESITPGGARKWSVALPDGCQGAAIDPGGGAIHLLLDNRTIVSFDALGGKRWEYPASLGACIAAGPDGAVYFGGLENQLFALEPDGSLRWSVNLGGKVSDPPIIRADGTVLVRTWKGGLTWVQHAFHAVDARGRELWSHPLGDTATSPAAAGPDGTIYFRAGDGKLCALQGSR